ncbi:hypothetical protein EV215_1348 [Hypnocyclicus thermotrophus]|uniref:Universal stress protein family protein n=1 Tax=Hypnocyclicus thermotrophus TaxID=1627895 RepID=A0AA46I5V5_9FUSO|nr:hypothetical protein [Hypnocyclicus thermotrophus]TDT69807.1 hypothetical protein EV215_1348 [Hypnocyclicus thermotrophus]
MLNRVLVYFSSEEEVDYLLSFMEVLKKKYKNIEITGIYVKDISKYDVIPPMVEGLVIDSTNNYILSEWNELEQKHEKQIKEKFLNKIEGEFYTKEGNASDELLEEMKLHDLLIFAKEIYLKNEIKNIFKLHYKPIIAVPKLAHYNFEKILIADDNGLNINKSFFEFIKLFDDIKEFTALSINSETESKKDLNIYLNKIDKKINYKEEIGNEVEILKDYAYEADILVIGNLRYSFILEKLTGKIGVKIIEKINKPIFLF